MYGKALHTKNILEKSSFSGGRFDSIFEGLSITSINNSFFIINCNIPNIFSPKATTIFLFQQVRLKVN